VSTNRTSHLFFPSQADACEKYDKCHEIHRNANRSGLSDDVSGFPRHDQT
jgi:hypothetical protein